MRVLLITEPLPYPIISGPAIRIHNLLERIARTNEVWLATLLMSPSEQRYIPQVEGICAGVITGNRELYHPLQHLPGLIANAWAGKPLELKFQWSHELANKLSDLVSQVDFDIIQIEHSYMAQYLDVLPKNKCFKSILVFRNVVFSQFARMARVEHKPVLKMRRMLHSLMMSRWEPAVAQRFDRCVALSDADKTLLLNANPGLQIDVIPNGVDSRENRPLDQNEEEPVLLFIGSMDYSANADAAVFFCKEILPRIKRRMGDVKVWIVGNDPLPEVRNLEGNEVRVVGRVEDVKTYYERSKVCIVPLRAGSGTRLKILESMAFGRPVVSTTLGCEGLDVEDERHLLIADSPDDFADKTVRLLTDQQLYRKIRDEARQLVVEKYDWDIIAGKMLALYSELALDHKGYDVKN